MTATDLMIGDWVSWNGHNLKVKGTAECDCYFGLDAISDIIPNDELAPIPLTAEILEKNGFEYGISDARRNFAKIVAYGTIIKDEKWHTRFDELVLEKRTEKDEDGEYIIWDIENFVGITDVHELQHALRLCGLNDLADNFRV